MCVVVVGKAASLRLLPVVCPSIRCSAPCPFRMLTLHALCFFASDCNEVHTHCYSKVAYCFTTLLALCVPYLLRELRLYGMDDERMSGHRAVGRLSLRAFGLEAGNGRIAAPMRHARTAHQSASARSGGTEWCSAVAAYGSRATASRGRVSDRGDRSIDCMADSPDSVLINIMTASRIAAGPNSAARQNSQQGGQPTPLYARRRPVHTAA